MPAHLPPMQCGTITRVCSFKPIQKTWRTGAREFRTHPKSNCNKASHKSVDTYLHFQHGQLCFLSIVGRPSCLRCMANCRHLLCPLVASSGLFMMACFVDTSFPSSHILFPRANSHLKLAWVSSRVLLASWRSWSPGLAMSVTPSPLVLLHSLLHCKGEDSGWIY